MSRKTLMKFKDININDMTYIENKEIKQNSSKSVAIIGMSGRVGKTQNIEELWNLLINEQEEYRNLPNGRKKDVNDYLKFMKQDIPNTDDQYLSGSVMDDISSFDYRFFSLSLQEARRMDPNQRIFLETAWSALEDAGYIGENIEGTDTGVFVGFSSDFGENYRMMLKQIELDTPATSVVGNINSIIASRISYQLNLRGPAILFDTACSSGLVAIYEAFRAIQSRECSMAIAGSVKCNPLPIYPNQKSSIGIKTLDETGASDGHTRTFDNASDGTSHAEGTFAFILKDLDKAQRDGDHIRAVIVGGAVNQDGASNGITAPNMAAQEDLIKKALKDANLNAEDISYIEAHGTGTKLGDPIEVGGIQRAFSCSTSKKQFCAIGSIKTNIGHMDNASGTSGLAKVILSMEHRKLPASLNFNIPNRNIPFIKSPVYVNDRLTDWEEDGQDLYAGINSFGLAGTNCHLILKSAPKEQKYYSDSLTGMKLLTLSAKSTKNLKDLAKNYHDWLNKNNNSIEDILFTAYVGRMHFNKRLAVLFHNCEELSANLLKFANSDSDEIIDENIKYGQFSVVIGSNQKKDDTDITSEEYKKLTRQAFLYSQQVEENPTNDTLIQLAKLYVQGATLPWEWLSGGRRKRISLPTYPFTKSRCWIEIPERKQNQRFKYDLLRDVMTEVPGNYIFTSMLSTELFWELNEHRINGVSIIPGTGLIEIMMQAMHKVNQSNLLLKFQDLIFERPFAVQDTEKKQLSVWVEDIEEYKKITIYSRDIDSSWIQHASCTCSVFLYSNDSLNIDKIRKSLDKNFEIVKEMETTKKIVVSNRWTESYVSGLTNSLGTEFLIQFRLPSIYSSEIQNYFLHPALLDISVNAINGLINETEVFLPFSYGSLKIYKNLPEHIYVHIKRKDKSSENIIYSLNITICDIEGNLVLEAEDYCIKAITHLDILKNNESQYGFKQFFEPFTLPNNEEYGKCSVLAAGPDCRQKQILIQELQSKGHEVYITNSLSSIKDIKDDLQGKTFTFGFYYCNISGLEVSHEKWKYEMHDSVYECVTFLKELTVLKIKFSGALSILTHYSHKVLESDNEIHPGLAALTGIWQVVALEYEHLNLRCIDTDIALQSDMIIRELLDENRKTFIAYRNNVAYVPSIKSYKIPQKETANEIDPNGVMIISGGTGSLGTHLAQYLVKKGFRKIVLLGSEIKQRNNKVWEEISNECDIFEVYGFPIENYEEVTKKITFIRENLGYIQGVFHLAGRAGDGYLHNKPMEVFHSVYDGKALGAMNLHLATIADNLKYFAMYSSISSLRIKAGQSDYTGANMALDAIAEYRNISGLPALSIQWPAWKEIGMAHRMGAIDKDLEYSPIDPNTSMELLDSILLDGSKKVSVIMPGRRLINTVNSSKIIDSNETNVINAILIDREEPDEIEQIVADIWSIILGLKELSFYDEFIYLGGNSILTSQMLKEYNKKFPQVMEITDLFSYTTIQTQSQYIKSKIGTTNSKILNTNATLDERLDDILDQIIEGNISILETTKLI